MDTFVILGCGYTGTRVTERLLSRGSNVVATTRDPERLSGLAAAGARLSRLDVTDLASLSQLRQIVPSGARVLLSVPTLRSESALFDPTAQIVEALGAAPSRVVYLSTTGVYGLTAEVDETTPAAPVTERQRLRLAAEEKVQQGPWSSLILRPAAIYGPGRGVHAALREGRFQLLGDGSNFVSRIHVDDLAAHAERGLLSEVTGSYPVADDEPCPSREIAEFCARLLKIPLPSAAKESELSETRRSNRRVDGRAIRRALQLELQYRSYKLGIPAAVAAEKSAL